MRFENYTRTIDESVISNQLFNAIKKVGERIGINIKRSDTIFDYLSKAQSNLVDLYTYATLYFLSKDPEQKKQLKNDMAGIIKNVNTKEIAAFLMQLDRATIGLTAHVRHILMSLFGIEIATYNKIYTNTELIQKEIGKIRKILNNIKNVDKKVISALDNFEFMLMQNLKEDATLTGDIAKFDKKIPFKIYRRIRKKRGDCYEFIRKT